MHTRTSFKDGKQWEKIQTQVKLKKKDQVGSVDFGLRELDMLTQVGS